MAKDLIISKRDLETVTKLQAELDTQKKQITLLNKELDVQKNQATKLQTELDIQKKLMTKLENELTIEREKVIELKNELTIEKKKVADLTKELEIEKSFKIPETNTNNISLNPNAVIMPNLIGFTETACSQMLLSFDLKLDTIYQYIDPENKDIANGQSVKQSVAAGDIVNRGDIIAVVFAKKIIS